MEDTTLENDTTVEAVGGWLKEAEGKIERGHRRLIDISLDALNPEYMAYFEDYRSRYFNDKLMPGQGVEEILVALREHGETPDRWIDLGAGVTTLFWSIGVRNPGQIIACDLVPEALSVLSQFKDSNEMPPCYSEAMAIIDTTQAEFDITRQRTWDYHVFDCHAPWTLAEYSDGANLITAIGCFGIAPDSAHYAKAFKAAAQNVRAGGRFIGADWVRSAAFVESEGHNNGYVSSELTKRCGDDCGLKLLECTHVPIQGDPNYDSVLVWAFSS